MAFFEALSPCLIGMEACASTRANEARPRGLPDAGEARDGLCKAQ
jgi:hypothetical protein